MNEKGDLRHKIEVLKRPDCHDEVIEVLTSFRKGNVDFTQKKESTAVLSFHRPYAAYSFSNRRRKL